RSLRSPAAHKVIRFDGELRRSLPIVPPESAFPRPPTHAIPCSMRDPSRLFGRPLEHSSLGRQTRHLPRTAALKKGVDDPFTDVGRETEDAAVEIKSLSKHAVRFRLAKSMTIAAIKSYGPICTTTSRVPPRRRCSQR